ncbi:MAG: polyprenyl synthetase family protein [Proteobacteria bacterium]|nr:polyprenyl synthetase family protein [Pseudomonadota bacterium]
MSDLKNKILSAINKDLVEIELALKNNLKASLDLTSQVAGHILFSGGKRFRPLLMILSARICGYKGNMDKTYSTIFEYLHAATLLHDDIIDGATLRRGKPVAHSIWGTSIAVLAGDFLLGRSLSISTETELPKVIKIITKITEEMSQGEIHQLTRIGDLDLTEEEYMEIIRRKTAVLMQGACWTGALIATASEKEEKALSEYGFNLGIAFQMTDDLLDYTSDTSILGKEIGADLKEGKLTLPVIYSLKEASSEDKTIMEKIITDKNFSFNDFKILIKLLEKYGGIEYTKKLASEHIEKAKKSILFFEPSETKELLLNMADYALIRKA